VNYADLRERVLQGGSDEEILEWCFEKGRRLNEGDIVVWNGFASKLGCGILRRQRSSARKRNTELPIAPTSSRSRTSSTSRKEEKAKPWIARMTQMRLGNFS
jgi:hypothetical protein